MNQITFTCALKVNSFRISFLTLLDKTYRANLARLTYLHEYQGALSSPLPKWYRKLIAKSIFHRAWISGRFYWVRSNGALSVNSFKDSDK